MNKINEESVVDIHFELKWESDQAIHNEIYEVHNVNMWRDCLPKTLVSELMGKTSGEIISMDLEQGEFVPGYDPRKTFEIKDAQFNPRLDANKEIEPRMGRFYPKGFIKGIAGIFPQNFQPFRCVGIENGRLSVDMNHPLAKTAVSLRAFIKDVKNKSAELGGSCHDWAEIISNGPGMQARWANIPTDFFSDNPFQREDEAPDGIFYQEPRLVKHIDDAAIDIVESLYRRLLKDGMRVLDLMSSYHSHVPADIRLDKLTGLGLNSEELKQNLSLNDRIIHDLNENPLLPFETESYDAVICTVSIEYLIRPEAVFNEIVRILRPGGYLIVTFSNRWFPPKVIHIWKELHEYERMGLVLEYFQQTQTLKNLETYSIRGLPRPRHDKYFLEIKYSDPIYAVWGQKS